MPISARAAMLTLLIATAGLVVPACGDEAGGSSTGTSEPDAADRTEDPGDTPAEDATGGGETPADTAETAVDAADDPGDDPEPDAGGEPAPDDVSTGEEDAAGPDPECDDTNAFYKCDDIVACTEDACVDGLCLHTPIPGCCAEDTDCDDGVACTVGECNLVKHECLFAFEDNTCCLTDDDCDDGNACTMRACVSNLCVTSEYSCDCSNNLGCADGNPCTADICNTMWGICANVPDPTGAHAWVSCCTDDAACDDDDPATFDWCQVDTAICGHAPTGCASDADCPSLAPCLAGTCGDDGQCAWGPPHEHCCADHVACDDGVAATTDACVDHQCVSFTGEAQVACAPDTPCPAGGACLEWSCRDVAGRCHAAPAPGPGCCSGPADCPAPPACTQTLCDATLSCVEQATGGHLTHFGESFDQEGALSTWTIEGDATPAGWQISGKIAHSPASSLYYGRVPQHDYDVGATAGQATSPVIAAPSGSDAVMLGFWIYADVEPISSRDLIEVSLVDAAGSTVVWTKDDLADGTQAMVELDVTEHISGPVQIRVRFDSVDGLDNDGLGVFVDDVELYEQCP